MSIKEYLTKIDSNTVNDVKCKKHLKTYVFFCTKCNTNYAVYVRMIINHMGN